MSDVEVIRCSFEVRLWIGFENLYTCFLRNTRINCANKYQFNVESCRDIKQIEAFQFFACNMPKIPPNLPFHQFQNLIVFSIEHSKLATITKDDFSGFRKENLRAIKLVNNNLEYLPDDLFDGMDNLEQVSFSRNKIKYIEPDLINSFAKLKFLNLEKNENINKLYPNGFGNRAVFKEMKNYILENCPVPNEIREKYNPKAKPPQNLPKMKTDVGKKSKEDLMREIAMLSEENNQLKDQNELLNEMKAALKKEKFKDFIITVGDQEFTVHKLLLIARSPVLAEMIENNPDASCLQLENIPLDIFQHILNYLYNDTLPHDSTTFKEIFIAAGRLKIEKLKNYSGAKLIGQINKDNAFEMLSLANKYDHEGLRLKAFKIIKGLFPDRSLEDEVSKNQESIDKLFKIQKMRKSLELKINEEFESLQKIDSW